MINLFKRKLQKIWIKNYNKKKCQFRKMKEIYNHKMNSKEKNPNNNKVRIINSKVIRRIINKDNLV
jgi:hypothetical protein